MKPEFLAPILDNNKIIPKDRFKITDSVLGPDFKGKSAAYGEALIAAYANSSFNKGAVEIADDNFEVACMGEAIFTNGNNPKLPEFILSFGAGPCVIVSIHDPQTKKSGMAHFQIHSSYNDVFKFINDLRPIPNDKVPLQISIAGGSQHTTLLLKQILHICEGRADMKITGVNMLRGLEEGETLVLNTRTGETYNDFKTGKNLQDFGQRADYSFAVGRLMLIERHLDNPEKNTHPESLPQSVRGRF